MRLQTLGSNTWVSVQYVWPYVCLWAFKKKLYQFPVWGSSVAIHLSPHWCLGDPSGVKLILYVYLSVCISVCLSISISPLISVCSFRTIFRDQRVPLKIVHNTCSRRTLGWRTASFKIYKSYMLITMCQLTSSSYVEPMRKGPNPLEIDPLSGSIIWLYIRSYVLLSAVLMQFLYFRYFSVRGPALWCI